MTGDVKRLVVLRDGSTTRIVVTGRKAWALFRLIEAGPDGCTPLEEPGPRWSGYVARLRLMGFDIETVRERHSGPYAGNHGRYVLRSRVTIVEQAVAA